MYSPVPREIAYDDYLDKTLGCWIGKSLGGIIGAPFENHKIRGEMTADNCWPSELAPNDDLDIQVVWLEALEERGPRLTHRDLVEIWQDRCWYNFSEYGSFLYNAQRGIAPPYSGSFNNEFFRESMGCPIRAEIWGESCPGSPAQAAIYARQDGELDHAANSVWAEQFWAVAVAEAFFAHTLEEALEAGRKVVPPDSDIARIADELPSLVAQHDDWRRVWQELIRRYGHRDGSKVQINFAFTLLALLKGEGDLKRTLVAAINYGWDADCTAATAGALVGVLRGAKAMPQDWVKRMGDHLTCDVNAKHKTSSLLTFAEDTCKVGIEATLTLCLPTRVIGVPTSVQAEVDTRINARPAPSVAIISVDYPSEPILTIHNATAVTLTVTNRSDATIDGDLAVHAPEGIIVSPNHITLHLPAGQAQQIGLMARYTEAPTTVWDKNLLTARFHTASGVIEQTFGLAGARHWRVYGPYWDAWDTTLADVCPYRNEKLITHPVHVDGCQEMMFHEHVRMDRAYLDEEALMQRDLPEENPFTVECGIDLLTERDLGGFLGEAGYYLVREISSVVPVKCNANLGSIGPITVWVDGVEVLRADRFKSWTPNDYGFQIDLDDKPRRVVIKCARITDAFALSLCFIKLDVPGDKLRGISYLIDTTGSGSTLRIEG